MRPFLIAAALTLILSACAAPKDEPAQTEMAQSVPTTPLMRWADLTNRPMPQPDASLSLGSGDHEVVDIWIPSGDGPHPVVIMIHGGCWQKTIADRSLMHYAAAELRDNGLAVWNIEYRGVDEPGGGYPGTYLDVARAADSLTRHADSYNLDLSRVAGFGHSAGGHLITWLAGRDNIAKDSPVYSLPKLKLRGVLNSGGLADLDASEPLTLPSCLAAIKAPLIGEPSVLRPDPLSDTSSDRLLPTGVTLISVNGEKDRIAPPELGTGFTAKAIAAGDKARTIIIPNEGHVELIAPGSKAFDHQIELLKSLLTD